MNLSNIKALILDMDGVLWRENTPIGDLPVIFARIRERGLKFACATNNASRTVDEFLEKFASFNVELEPWQIVTSSLATAHKLGEEYPEGSTIFVVGENGIQRALEQKGFRVIVDPENDTSVDAVVVGIDWHLNYPKLRRATFHIRAGAAFYGTNPDKSFPTPQGLAPGAGSILAALEAASDVKPLVIGKPEPFMMQLALERMESQPDETLVVGDRLETDISAGQAADCRTALVLSGVTTRDQADQWKPAPDFIYDDLNSMLG